MGRIWMWVYADSTGLYTEQECECDNLIDLEFNEDVVKKWYELNKEDFDRDTAYELNKPEEECTYEDWRDEVSWAELTDGLFDFAIANGDHPIILGINTQDYVFYRDDNNFKTIVFEGNYDDCRYFGREHSWKFDGNELEMSES